MSKESQKKDMFVVDFLGQKMVYCGRSPAENKINKTKENKNMNNIIITVYHPADDDSPDVIENVIQCNEFCFVADTERPWNRGIIHYVMIHPATGEQLGLEYTISSGWFAVEYVRG